MTGVDPRLVLAGIVLLALVVRLVAIGSRVHVDDGYSWLVASSPSPHVFLRRLAAYENTPPLFYLLLSPLPIDHPAWLRVPAAIPGTLLCVVLFYSLRNRLGARAALLAALAVAVSPFLITYSDLGRGFMLEDLALLVALWAVLRLGDGESMRWWAVFVLAGVVALYTEYDSAIFLLSLAAAALWLGRPSRRHVALATGAMFLALVPWIPQMVRAQDQVHKTKLDPMFGTTSLTAVRNVIVDLALGENGGTSSSAGRWLELCAMLALALGAVIALRRGWDRWDDRGRRTILLVAATAALTFAGHALAGAVGINLFTQRYMTIMIPLVAVLAAAALASLDARWVLVASGAVLAVLGAIEVVRRYHGEYEPNFDPVRAAALAVHPRTVLTNTPIVLYDLPSLHPAFDRPSNLGPGLAGSCARPCLVIDDARVYGGTARKVSGTQTFIAPFVLTLER